MSSNLLLLLVTIFVALAFDFLNGFHDAANSIATVVSTRVLSPKLAVVWAAFFNFVAFLIFPLNVAGMMGKGSHRMFLEQSEAIVKQGIPVVPQVACRPLNFEFDLAEPFVFESMPIFNTISGKDREGKATAYRDPSFRQKVKDATAAAYTLSAADTYVRTVVESPQTVLYLNPIVRYDGAALPVPMAGIQPIATWLLRFSYVAGLAVVAALVRKRRARPIDDASAAVLSEAKRKTA